MKLDVIDLNIIRSLTQNKLLEIEIEKDKGIKHTEQQEFDLRQLLHKVDVEMSKFRGN